MRLTLCLAVLALPALMAGCSAGSSDPDLTAPRGTTLDTMQGVSSGAEPLRPESGNIWGEGLLQPNKPAR